MGDRRMGGWDGVRRVGLAQWALAALVALSGCVDSHGDGGGPQTSTETGNPPVLDSDLVALVVTADELHLRGEPGAVTPAIGEIEVVVLGTGEVVTGRVNADGSFDIELDASLDDAFEVRVVYEGQRSAPVYVIRGGAAVGQAEDGGLSCEQRSELASQVLAQAVSAADRSCVRDADCRLAPASTCAGGCQRAVPVSAMDESQIADTVDALADGLCNGFAEDGCTIARLPCPSGPLGVACVDGECVETPPQTDPVGTCEECLDAKIGWRIISAGVLPAMFSNETYNLRGCNQFTINGNGTCTTELMRCTAVSNGVIAVNAALAHPDVVQALEEGAAYGEPQNRSGFVYEINVDGRIFQYRTCADQPNVTCNVVAGLQALVELLEAVRIGHSCMPASSPGADCGAPFDEGQGDAVVPVYWHDPDTKTCIQRGYRGAGGNDNRYASAEACEQACPPPSSAEDCAPGWSFVEQACVDCGPIACTRSVARCTKPCEDDEDCAYDRVFGGYCLPTGLCNSSFLCPF